MSTGRALGVVFLQDCFVLKVRLLLHKLAVLTFESPYSFTKEEGDRLAFSPQSADVESAHFHQKLRLQACIFH